MVEVDAATAAAAAPIRNDEQQQINGYTQSKKENESANEKYAVQNFVTEYVRTRLHQHGGYCPQFSEAPSRGSQQDEIIREVVQIFEEKNAAQLRSMVNTLCATRSLTFQRYVEVVECFARSRGEPLEHLSYGRLVALLAFAGVVAAHLSDYGEYRDITNIVLYTSKFLEKQIALTWEQNRRSWEKFFAVALTVIHADRDAQPEPSSLRDVWLPIASRLAVCGFFAFGAFALFRALLSAR